MARTVSPPRWTVKARRVRPSPVSVRIAVIGCGSWGINHVRSARKIKNAELAAVCDADPKARELHRGASPVVDA